MTKTWLEIEGLDEIRRMDRRALRLRLAQGDHRPDALAIQLTAPV